MIPIYSDEANGKDKSLNKILTRLKPGVPRQTHLFLAALLWTVIGCVLMVRGSVWLVDKGSVVSFVIAILLGTLKSLLILDKSAKKSIDRIQRLADGSCLGAVYSVKTWLLVMAMMLFGYILRHSGVPLIVLGSLYITIGWALLFSSRTAWITWKNNN